MKHSILILWLTTTAFLFASQAQEHPDFEITQQCKTSSVKSQDRTGTCWAFTAISFLESEILRKGGNSYDLSEMFIVRNVYPVKAERYIRMHGNNNFGQGGQAHDALQAFAKYGIVPETIYTGLNYGSDRHNHSLMAKLLKTTADEYAQPSEKLRPDWKNYYKAVLNGFLGTKPERFTYQGKEYTPKSFAEETGINASDYIELTSYSHRPYYKPFVLEVPDNWSHDLYYNVPPEDMTKIMKNALRNGYSISWDGDVSGEGFSHQDGKADLTDKEKKLLQNKGTEEFRQILFNNFSVTDDHLMHITGLAKDADGRLWFQTKNSWGESNDFGGYLYMSDDYIKGMTVAIMIHKDALPEKIKRKILK